jgi:hypothetical protein
MIPLLPEDSDGTAWLRTQLTDWLCTQVREGCTRVVLRECVEGGERHLRAWSVADTHRATLAAEIGGRISDEGRQRHGVTIFGLFSFRANDAAMHVDRMLLLSRSLVR